jgi:hypothetical protein
MRALIVYESMFGNTEECARAVAKGVQEYLTADLVDIGAAPSGVPDDVDLVILGGPTHAHGLSRPGTRQSAADAPGRSPVSGGNGLREWLEHLAPPRHDVAVAAFDTRFDKPRWLTGSAAAKAVRILRALRYRVVAEPASFFVTSTSGPIAEGEHERAQRWGASLGASVVPSRQP